MRAISSVLISFVCFYMARHIKPSTDKGKQVNGFFGLLSWVFLIVSVTFMVLGM
jgi:hypothetical protein